ncbi:MAG: QacE family quaternary ammonium compound efflux SMR transporter [Candidatus Methanomethylophilaceae archaeon]|nr:QacE family quaternary ammonium compound efflux SMR transporter [Candidatus Methanomethylophilaceae archaeon]MBR2348367.1 QacE family quaternary ammonium compound efflux SMR transporter [Candidatus Methanomethylophilaceae archaeon]
MNIEGNTKLGWALIVLGGVFQIGWSIGLDYSEGLTNLMWDVIVLVSLFLSMLCLSLPMKSGINMSTAYAVWVGIGVVLTIIFSAVLGLETVTIGMLLFMMMILAGVIGLKLES